jgi:hypothetical protein
MTERQWERVGAASGIGFVALLLVSVFVAPSPPHIDASTAKILTYYSDHRTALLTGAMLGGLAGIFFLWFLGHLRHVLQRAEGGVEALSPIVFASGVATVAIAFVGSLPAATLALTSHSTEIGGNPALVRVLYDMNSLANSTIMLCAALFAASAALAMVLKEMASPLLGWLGLLLTPLLVAVAIAGFYATTYSRTWTVLTYSALLGFAAFVLVISGEMLAWPEATRRHAVSTSRGPIVLESPIPTL